MKIELRKSFQFEAAHRLPLRVARLHVHEDQVDLDALDPALGAARGAP